MGLDIRTPLGLIFLALGAIMIAYGLTTLGSPIYRLSGGLNINLIWGAVMFLFGAAMYLSYRWRKTAPGSKPDQEK
jgi:uncharacterized membrane protein HdeD (DUF308 family)